MNAPAGSRSARMIRCAGAPWRTVGPEASPLRAGRRLFQYILPRPAVKAGGLARGANFFAHQFQHRRQLLARNFGGVLVGGRERVREGSKRQIGAPQGRFGLFGPLPPSWGEEINQSFPRQRERSRCFFCKQV